MMCRIEVSCKVSGKWRRVGERRATPYYLFRDREIDADLDEKMRSAWQSRIDPFGPVLVEHGWGVDMEVYRLSPIDTGTEEETTPSAESELATLLRIERMLGRMEILMDRITRGGGK